MAGVRRFFATGTPASAAPAPGGSGSLPADIDSSPRGLGARAAPPASQPSSSPRPRPAGGVETEASTRPGTAAGPDVEPDAQPAKRGRRRVGRQVDIRVARVNPFTLPPPGPVATWR